ncbi:DsbA family protein [Tropicibacter oceani]|uniref:DsbA family protein n=1 Tax=Tropicibacter oceani TaxID=3058420 RepID=A0ABY8QDJ3_9RHOB|nr:DsbA family protein [Tropicibacter oceani]WGW02696.1 DsbA family protein [Tropicibacter oceani]
MTHLTFRPLRPLALIAALTLGGAAQAEEIDFGNMSPEQEAAFGAKVRDYLMTNPQVIMEAVALLEQQEAQQQAAADDALVETNAEALFNDGYSWVGGNPEGDITIVEFMDYRCGYCRKAFPEVEELIKTDGNIRLIVKEFPILGEASLVSSKFAIATQIVAGDEAYEQVHNALMALEGGPGKPVLTRLATTLGLDADAILAEMDSDEVQRRIADTRALAQRMQINGTPSFVMGGEMLRGYVPLDGMRQIVEQARAEQ